MDSLHCGTCFTAYYTTSWSALSTPARACPTCEGTLELDDPAAGTQALRESPRQQLDQDVSRLLWRLDILEGEEPNPEAPGALAAALVDTSEALTDATEALTEATGALRALAAPIPTPPPRPGPVAAQRAASRPSRSQEPTENLYSQRSPGVEPDDPT